MKNWKYTKLCKTNWKYNTFEAAANVQIEHRTHLKRFSDAYFFKPKQEWEYERRKF